jgi:DNA-binding LacI/PurR family transcriptional regulator
LRIPVVAFDREAADPRVDAVIVDNLESSRRANEHLIRLGHRQIGFIGGRHDIKTGSERSAGYEAAMAAAGLVPRAADGDFRLEQGRLATEQLLADGDLTALVVANNLMTVGALQAIRARGLRVPDDLAVVAMDDPFWAALIDPPLTTLAQPVHRMADAAVRLLFERIEGTREQARCIVFDCELRVRDSCGASRH